SLTSAANDELEITVEDPTRVLRELTSWAVEKGFELEGLQVSRPTLEDVYLELTGGEAGSE
ncbi:MAG TPA: ABC transporter ATP-binding protein, partial [Actinomycetota bacterium]|nr:ABC transporter ATP-binding protein [Actinomycetota bacterium]